MSQTLDDTGRLDTMITELSVHLWGPKSSSLYHTKSEIKKLAEAYAIHELEKLNNKWESRRLIGTVTARIDIDEVIARLKEHNQPNN